MELTELNPPERSRTYTFMDDYKVTIVGATHFLARESGTHRLKTADGKLHIVQAGWVHIEIAADGFTL